MQAYFNDEFNFDSQWQYTHIHISEKVTPFYQLYTGGKYRRFILSSPKNVLYFGYAKPYCSGAMIIQVDDTIDYDNMPIPAITSPDVESFKQNNPENLYQYWANFYAKALLKSSTTFLKQGSWRILPSLTDRSQDLPTYNPLGYPYRHNQVILQRFSPIKTFVKEQSLIDFVWGIMADDDSIFFLKNLPEADSGRVKFWRKKIRENACPPLLVWYQPHLHAYLLVDGHARFQAHLLENLEPKILAIEQFFKQTYPLDEEKREQECQKVFSGLQKNFEKTKKPLATDTLNGIVLQLYDDYSHDRQTLMAKPIANLDEIWQSQLNQLVIDGKLTQAQVEFFKKEEN